MKARETLIVGGLGVVLLCVGSMALIWRLTEGDRTPVGLDAREGGALATGPASPPAALAPGLPPSGDAAGALPRPPVAPGRISSRRHRGGAARRELAGASPQALGTQLLAGLSGLRVQVDECVRSSLGGIGTGGETPDAATSMRALAAQSGLDQGPLRDEAAKILRDMERVARGSATRRTLLLDIETLDGSVRIVDVSPEMNGSSDEVVTCARQELRGKVIPAPAARVGSRFQMASNLGPSGDP